MKPSTLQTLFLLRANPQGVTQLDALHTIGSFRLGARILELRQAGYAIRTDWIETYSGKRVAKYVLTETPAHPTTVAALEADEPEQMTLGVAS